ncbi:Serine/threonine protein phosphatase [Rhodovulum sp. P5]|uniref:metallophosphoesterase n=1 Tax=Rhodovulum sp. P5 TaxID=1564506 RepID=UPI0009C327EB|nr:metallophosphoesterase [Rhodovulum sp. P5]ARE40859.1 Serine/threonine protein phosphatase [Rhodovulum sp. P5]
MIWKRILGRSRGADAFAPPAPDRPFAAIGDVHGRVDLLERLLGRIDPAFRIICVGDYVDRGEHSAEVLRLLNSREDVLCIGGNHEDMMMGFLNDPGRYGARWLRNGGLQAMASFGVAGVTETSPEPALTEARDKLREAMGRDLVTWLETLPSHWSTGNVGVVHAAADPNLPLVAQSSRVLRWGHPDFRTTPRPDGLWVVHGHTIVDEPVASDGRIAIDTGAYATGRLTAAQVSSDGVEFITA